MIGNSYNKKGEYNKSLQSYMKSLQIKRQTLEEDHPDTSATINTIERLKTFI